MPVTDAWTAWTTTAATNSPAGTATPEIDDEIRNIKAECKTNLMALGDAQTVTGAKTFNVNKLLVESTVAGYLQNSTAGVVSYGNPFPIISTADLPTGIDAANIADGSVSNAEFQYLNGVSTAIQTQINNINTTNSYALLQNRQNQNTSGGTATTGSWGIIPLNTEQEDTDNIVDVSALPAFSLGAGTYLFNGYCPFYNCNGGQSRLYNVTDASVVTLGSVGMTGAVSNVSSNSVFICTLTISGTKQFRVEYSVGATRNTDGLGAAGNLGVEVFAQLFITKLA
jgi:hypothetical protein